MIVQVRNGKISEDERKLYEEYALHKYGSALEGLDISVDGDEVELKYHLKAPAFERIRRITGYLVGTTDRWNDAKQAEEKDRVKHDVQHEDH